MTCVERDLQPKPLQEPHTNNTSTIKTKMTAQAPKETTRGPAIRGPIHFQDCVLVAFKGTEIFTVPVDVPQHWEGHRQKGRGRGTESTQELPSQLPHYHHNDRQDAVTVQDSQRRQEECSTRGCTDGCSCQSLLTPDVLHWDSSCRCRPLHHVPPAT